MSSCPVGFTVSPTTSGTCIVDHCPSMFELRVREGVPACVYTPSPDIFFTLRTTEGIPIDPSLSGRPVRIYIAALSRENNARFQALIDDYTAKSATAVGGIEKTQLLQDKFKALQSAENVRDQAPEAYQKARMDYYTTLNGEGWLDQERERISKSEVEPKVQSYANTYTDLTNRLDKQQQTYDIVVGVKDKMLSMKDDFQYTTRTFAKQIEELKSQINIERKKRSDEQQSVYSWLDAIFNVLIIIITITAIVLVIRKLINRQRQTYTPGYSYY